MAKAAKGKTHRAPKAPAPEPAAPKPFLRRPGGQIAVLLAVGFLAMIGYRISQSPIYKPPPATAVAIGGPFTLVDHQGRPVSEADFKGRFMLVYFGYTFCPDVCPTALTDMGNALDILGGAADKVAPVFITVDPERDTPEHLKEYIGYFHPRMVGLTGTPEQVKAATKVYKVYAAKAPVEGEDAGDYLMDHTSIIYLMGPDGAYKAHFSHGAGAEDIAKGMRKFL